jgi:transcriptional regulator with XRE-family HTH domain
MYAVMNSERMRKLREAKGMSRRDLADAAGISESTAGNAERGAVVQGETVHKVAEALGVDVTPSLARPASRPNFRAVS